MSDSQHRNSSGSGRFDPRQRAAEAIRDGSPRADTTQQSPRERRAAARKARQEAADRRRKDRATAKASAGGGRHASEPDPRPDEFLAAPALHVDEYVDERPDPSRDESSADTVDQPEEVTDEAGHSPPREGKESSGDADCHTAEQAVAQQAAGAERAAARAEADVNIAAAEAEREAERTAKAARSAGPVVPPPPSPADPTGGTLRRRVSVAVFILGTLGLVFSVILAVGAFLAAIEADASSGLVGFVSGTCDVLVGPLGGLVKFSGDQAAARADLVSRGIASMVYLVVGLAFPSLVHRGDD